MIILNTIFETTFVCILALFSFVIEYIKHSNAISLYNRQLYDRLDIHCKFFRNSINVKYVAFLLMCTFYKLNTAMYAYSMITFSLLLFRYISLAMEGYILFSRGFATIIFILIWLCGYFSILNDTLIANIIAIFATTLNVNIVDSTKYEYQFQSQLEPIQDFPYPLLK